MPGIGIIGGSGLYELLEDADEHELDTPYGPPSDVLVTGTFGGREVAFLPRHGRGHRLPPHEVPYRANLWALRELGVERLFTPCAVGALRAELTPGTFVVLDQFVDRTKRRADTFFDGPQVVHATMAQPYSPSLRRALVDALAAEDVPHVERGTIVVIEGPRFSTTAESRWYASAGFDVIGMTQVPEIPLARELGMCVAGLAMVTDHDAGLDDHPDIEPVTHAQVLEVFAANVEALRRVLERAVAGLPDEPDEDCAAAIADLA